MNISPILNYANGVQVVFSEEEFVLVINSGNQINRYAFSPKHTKRLLMVLEKQIKEYESKFSKIETKLPESKKGTTQEEKIGFK